MDTNSEIRNKWAWKWWSMDGLKDNISTCKVNLRLLVEKVMTKSKCHPGTIMWDGWLCKTLLNIKNRGIAWIFMLQNLIIDKKTVRGMREGSADLIKFWRECVCGWRHEIRRLSLWQAWLQGSCQRLSCCYIPKKLGKYKLCVTFLLSTRPLSTNTWEMI